MKRGKLNLILEASHLGIVGNLNELDLDLMGMEETTGKELDRKKIGDGLCADDVRAWALSVGRGQLLLWRPSHRHRARQGSRRL